MIGRIFGAALFAGLIAGLFLTGVQRLSVAPLILEAETYEHAAPGHPVGDTAERGQHPDAAGDGHAEQDAWLPDDGTERTLYTLLANLITGVAYGLLLSAAISLRRLASGRRIDWRHGLLWGLAGFGACNLAPALGLPPELPGAGAAELGARQGWWVLTSLLSVLGFSLIAFARRPWLRALGLLPLALPHLIGAPTPAEPDGLAPAALAERFIYASLVTNALFWLVLGGLTAYLQNRFAPPAPRQAGRQAA
jgi:cobalt transporter subunit CbtA